MKLASKPFHALPIRSIITPNVQSVSSWLRFASWDSRNFWFKFDSLKLSWRMTFGSVFQVVTILFRCNVAEPRIEVRVIFGQVFTASRENQELISPPPLQLKKHCSDCISCIDYGWLYCFSCARPITAQNLKKSFYKSDQGSECKLKRSDYPLSNCACN